MIFMFPLWRLLKFCHDYPVLEEFGFIAWATLAYPYMVRPVAVGEILVKLCLFFQSFHACSQFRFVTRKENGVDDSEIKVRDLFTIGTKAVFNRYFHKSLILSYFNYIFNSTIQSGA